MSKKMSQNSNQDNNTLDEALFKSIGSESHLTQDEFANINSNVQISPKNLDKLAVLQNATGEYSIQDSEFVEFNDLDEQSNLNLDDAQDVSSVIEAHQYSVDMNVGNTRVDNEGISITQAQADLNNIGDSGFVEVSDDPNADLEAIEENNGFVSQEHVSEQQSDTPYYEAGFNDIQASASEDLIESSDASSDITEEASTETTSLVSDTVAKVNEFGEKINPHGDVVGNNKTDDNTGNGNGNGNGKGASKKQNDIVDDETVAVTTETTTDTTTEAVNNTENTVTDSTSNLLDTSDDDSGSMII